MRLSNSVCHKLVLRRNDWTNRASLGMNASFHVSTPCCKEIRVSPKVTALPSQTLSWILKISPQQVDRVVNKTRRRSILLTTLTTADAMHSPRRLFTTRPSPVTEHGTLLCNYVTAVSLVAIVPACSRRKLLEKVARYLFV